MAVYIPPIDVAGCRGRRRAGRRGGAVRQAAGLVVPRCRGRARAAARARRRRLDGRPRLGAVVPRGRGRGAGPRPRRRVRRVAAHPGRPDRRSRTGSTTTAAKALVQRVLVDHPDGTRARAVGRAAALLAAYAVTLWEARPVSSLKEATAAGRGSRVGRRAQGHRRPAPRTPGPRARVAQHRPTVGDEGRLGHPRRADRRLGDARASWCRRTRHPACRSASGAWRTRCSGRSSRSASPAR